MIPSVPLHLRTQWHPTERKGPFETLQRGASLTEEGAIRWGVANLQGLPYTVRFIPSED